MGPDDNVCLCFHVPLGKIRAYVKREDPPVASLISECLGAGTGCGWCVPVLKQLHRQHQAGEPMEVRVDPEIYAGGRRSYQKTGERPDETASDGGESS
ncbi:MAG: (2Fe-2S)-binding protein [Phycisphaera sp.]|nr:MAG: (2Fe-2S)-binding protein [Phycisphaera sp.]